MSHVSQYVGRWWMVCLVAGTLGGAAAGASIASGSPPTAVARIVTGTAPCGAVSGFRSVWVAVYGTGQLVRIDPIRNRITRRIRVAPGICPVAIGAGSVWVASDKTNLLYRVDPRRGRVWSPGYRSPNGPRTSRLHSAASGSPRTSGESSLGSTRGRTG